MSKFWIELPADKYGNRAYTNSYPCVVEAELDETGTMLAIIAPDRIKNAWRQIPFRQYGGWLPVDGPARPLTWEEREDLIKAHCAQPDRGG